MEACWQMETPLSTHSDDCHTPEDSTISHANTDKDGQEVCKSFCCSLPPSCLLHPDSELPIRHLSCWTPCHGVARLTHLRRVKTSRACRGKAIQTLKGLARDPRRSQDHKEKDLLSNACREKTCGGKRREEKSINSPCFPM